MVCFFPNPTPVIKAPAAGPARDLLMDCGAEGFSVQSGFCRAGSQAIRLHSFFDIFFEGVLDLSLILGERVFLS